MIGRRHFLGFRGVKTLEARLLTHPSRLANIGRSLIPHTGYSSLLPRTITGHQATLRGTRCFP